MATCYGETHIFGAVRWIFTSCWHSTMLGCIVGPRQMDIHLVLALHHAGLYCWATSDGYSPRVGTPPCWVVLLGHVRWIFTSCWHSTMLGCIVGHVRWIFTSCWHYTMHGHQSPCFKGVPDVSFVHDIIAVNVDLHRFALLLLPES